MNIRALIPPGIDKITVNGLHQWDYGRVLEIECAEFGTEIMEAHFACQGSKVAEIRTCTFKNGIGTVTIPDKCLELSTPITAWVYGISNTYGKTIKTIILPIIQRPKPLRGHIALAENSENADRIEELLGAVNEAVEHISSGDITVARAMHAENADKANNATHAENASYAPTAGNAQTANYSDSAGAFSMRLVASCTITSGVGNLNATLKRDTPYLVVYESNTNTFTGMGCGVLITRSEEVTGYYWCCPVNHSHAAALTTNTRGITIFKGSALSAPGADTSENGSLKVYTFGSIS